MKAGALMALSIGVCACTSIRPAETGWNNASWQFMAECAAAFQVAAALNSYQFELSRNPQALRPTSADGIISERAAMYASRAVERYDGKAGGAQGVVATRIADDAKSLLASPSSKVGEITKTCP